MHWSVSIFSTLILLLVQVGLGVYVLLKTSRTKSTVSFALFCLSLALWAFAAQMLNNSGTVQQIEFWGRYVYLGPILLAYFFLYFSFVFPQGEITNIQLLVMSLPSVVFLFIMPTSLILKTGVPAVSGPIPIWGNAYPFFAIYFMSYFVLGIYNLVKKYRGAIGNKKAQIGYVFAGLFLAFLFGIIFNLILPSLGIGSYLNIGPYFTLLLIGFIAYAIVKHRLMDISVVISRTVAEFLAILFHGTIYLSLAWAYFIRTGTGIDWVFLTFTVIFGIIVGQTHHNIRIFIQTTSDKIFLRGKYDYYRALADASAHVAEKLALHDILKVLYDTFANVLEVSNPRIFLPEYFSEAGQTSSRYLVFDRVSYSPQTDGQEIRFDSPLVGQLIKQRSPVLNIEKAEHELYVPCLLEDRLIAVFGLGEKLSEDPFTEDDLRLLQTLAGQVAVALDHTHSYDKIRADLEVAERQLNRSQRLASLGILTAGVTHEIRNPLTVIRSETERLTHEPRDPEYLKQYQALLLKHIDRIAGIVERMLGLAKEKQHRETEVSLNEVAEATVQFFNFSQLKVIKDLQPVPPIKGDPEELQEVFVNLIQNACEAMPETGTLTLKSYQDDGHVVVEIADTGKGIPAEIREKIFDPFFSTRHEGVGLGLSIVYRIVREHGGDIKVESEVGKGTTFKLIF